MMWFPSLDRLTDASKTLRTWLVFMIGPACIDMQDTTGPDVCAAWLHLICFNLSIHLFVKVSRQHYMLEDAQSF